MGPCQSQANTYPKRFITPARSFLKVATLNFCGIMNSPFEFYCDDYLIQLKDISQEFLKVIPLYFPEYDKSNFKWNMGKIDVKYRDRYSPMFMLRAGIRQNNTIMTKNEYESHWQHKFSADIGKCNVQFSESQKEVTKKYDMAMWHTLLCYIYKVSNIEGCFNKDAKLYLEKLGPFYELSYLDENRKGMKLINQLAKIDADVFFFQEYSTSFYEAIKRKGQYYLVVDGSKDTLIIAKKTSFSGKPLNSDVFMISKVGQNLMKRLNWSDRTAFMIIDNYILINAHLSSKAEPNTKQIKQLKGALTELVLTMPAYNFILGGDLNSYLAPLQQSSLNIFPSQEGSITTVKKRTFTQGQFHKADKIVRESKDKIITNLEIIKGMVTYMDGTEPNENTLVPTNQHPFDHFVVIAQVMKKSK